MKYHFIFSFDNWYLRLLSHTWSNIDYLKLYMTVTSVGGLMARSIGTKWLVIPHIHPVWADWMSISGKHAQSHTSQVTGKIQVTGYGTSLILLYFSWFPVCFFSLKLPSPFCCMIFQKVSNLSHTGYMKALIILSHSWSTFFSTYLGRK